MRVEGINGTAFDIMLDDDVASVVGGAGFMTHMGYSSRSRSSDVIQRFATGVSLCRSDIDAFVELQIDDFLALTLRAPHVAEGSAFPNLRRDALEIAVHIHVKVLRLVLQEGVVVRRKIKHRGLNGPRQGHNEKKLTSDHWAVCFLGAGGFFPNSDSLPMIGNFFCRRAISSGMKPPGT